MKPPPIDQFGPDFSPISVSPTVFLVDDDPSTCRIIERIFSVSDIPLEAYESVESFLEAKPTQPLGCILTDLNLPGMTGIELFETTRKLGWNVPTLIITAYGKVDSCAGAFKAGVADYLQKPLNPDFLVQKVRECLDICLEAYKESTVRIGFVEKLKTLTGREVQVLSSLVEGNSMKAIASQYGTSFQAISRHRKRILEKLELQGDVALVRLTLQYRSDFDRLVKSKLLQRS